MPSIDLSRLRTLSNRAKLTLATSLVLLLALAWFLWAVFVPVSTDATKVVVTIPSGAGLSEVTAALDQEHLIRYPDAFRLWMWLSGSGGRIQPGSYEIAPNMNYREIRTMLVSGDVTRQRLTIPEGWTLKQIADQLDKQSITSGAQFLALAKFSSVPTFIPGTDPALPLEGYLFPDTYFFSPGTEPQAVIQAMLENFIAQTKSLTDKLHASGLSLPQVVNLASITEREARTPEDRRIVAGILLKRLRAGIPLQSDVTSLYEIGDFRHALTDADLKKATPYNTRITKGLPPTPIGNPGLDPIQAVLEPKESPYLFFIADHDGVMHYAKTQAEHEANVAKYLR